MRAIMLICALFIAALVTLNAPARANLNNSTLREKSQPVQAEAPRKEPTLPKEQEKAPTEQETAVEPETVAEAPVPEPQPLTDKEQLMQAAGIPQSDWAATDYIVSHESSWITTNTNPISGAYGLCQANPREKMASAGDDYMSNPVTQLKWCHSYSQQRYGGWWSSLAFWQKSSWW